MIDNQITALIVLGLISFCTLLFAFYKKFFSLPLIEERKDVLPKFRIVLTAYVLYLCFSLLIPSLFLMIASHLSQQGHFPIYRYNALVTTILNIVASFSSFIILLYYGLHYHKDIFLFFWKDRTTKTSLSQDIAFGFAFCILLLPVVLFFNQLLDFLTKTAFKISVLPDQTAVEIIKTTIHFPSLLILILITVTITAPIVEEILFRGFLQNWLKRFFGRGVAICFSSFIFAFYHFSCKQSLANIPIIGSLLLIGFFLGFLYEKRRSLISPIAFHGLFNLISTLIVIFMKGY